VSGGESHDHQDQLPEVRQDESDKEQNRFFVRRHWGSHQDPERLPQVRVEARARSIRMGSMIADIDPWQFALLLCGIAWCVRDYQLKRRDNADG
jgi:hypothetical protein